MTNMQMNLFIFVVLPLVFIAVWTYAIFYNRRLSHRIHEMEGPNGHLDSQEAGILAAMHMAKPTRTR